MANGISVQTTPKNRSSQEAGAAMLEAAFVLAVFAFLLGTFITFLLYLRVQTLSYDALRQSSLELLRVTAPINVRSPDLVAYLQCRNMRDIVNSKLENVELDPKDFKISFRTFNPEDGGGRLMQQVEITPISESIPVGTKSALLRYLPAPGAFLVHCQSTGLGVLQMGNGE